MVLIQTQEQQDARYLKEPDTTVRERILVVEDSEPIRELLTVILQRMYDVETATNGREALDILETDEFDLMLLDIMMPLVNGYDVLRELRTRENGQMRMPVILISAMGTPENVVEGFDLGANDYITKPIEPATLLARVKTQIKIKRLTDDREEYIAQLERNEVMQKQLTHMASHDLKAPLSNLQMAADLLQQDLNGNERIQPILDTIEMSVDVMGALVTDFLDVVRIQTRNMNLKLEPLALRDVVLDVLTQYEIAAQVKDIEVHFDQLEGVILADHARLVQVISNLVSNAIKYSPRGKHVTLKTSQKEGFVCLYVVDQGAGVPEKERELLFSEFGKTSTRPTEGETSTGLGLWIVKHLMLLMRGDVGAFFPDEGGSTFWIQVPAYDEA